MAGANQLSIYNGALSAMGERQLLSLTENRASRRALDDWWQRNGVLTCLAAGLWNFAARTVQWDFMQDFTPPFGFQCAFQIPTDWVRTMEVCEDEYLEVPHMRYSIEAGYLFSDLSRLWLKYVSSDVAFGGNMGVWPDNFCRFVECQFAAWTVRRITNSDVQEKAVNEKLGAARQKAKASDAMDEATKFLPPGTWSQARHGRRGWADLGNPYSLYGGA